MMKNCVLIDGQVINIGDWDFQIQSIAVSPAVLDGEGNVVTEALYEDRITNPIPLGAIIEQRDFEYDDNRGWYEIGTVAALTEIEKLRQEMNGMTVILGDLLLGGA